MAKKVKAAKEEEVEKEEIEETEDEAETETEAEEAEESEEAEEEVSEKKGKKFGVVCIHADGNREQVRSDFKSKKEAESCRAHHERVYLENLDAKAVALNKPAGSLEASKQFVVETHK